MRRIVLTIATAAMLFACKKEDDNIQPAQPIEEQPKLDCESASHWYIQIYQTCDKQGVSVHLIRNDESKRIDSTYEMGECRKVRTINWQGDSVIGYWTFPMNARAIGGGRSNCYRYGKNSIF